MWTGRFEVNATERQKGQLLATIDDPQTAQQLCQAQAIVVQLKAQLAQALANAKLTTLNNQRFEELYKQGGANDANVQAARANIDVLTGLKPSDRVILSPSDGITHGSKVDPQNPS